MHVHNVRLRGQVLHAGKGADMDKANGKGVASPAKCPCSDVLSLVKGKCIDHDVSMSTAVMLAVG